MTSINNAVIIGGGVAGPATALALRKAGIASTVYEEYGSTADGVGGVLAVAPNGLNALGIVDVDISALGQPIQRQVMTDGNGKRWFEFDGLPGLPASRVIWRSALHRALHDKALEQGIRIKHGKRLVRVDEAEDGVIAHFADGTSARGDVLIGADGIRSTVRKSIDPSAPDPTYVGLLGFGGYAVNSGVSEPTDAMYFAMGKRAFLGYWTAPEGGVMWFSNLPRETPLGFHEARAISAPEWLAQLREVHADDVPGCTLVEHTRPEDLFVLGAMEALPNVPRWHRGRMVLVGDSAHAPSSSSGQGVSLALESSLELARCLRDVADVSAAFRSYERLRRPRVEKIADNAAKTNGRKASGPIAKALVNLIMPIALKTFLTPERMFGWTHAYRIDWDRAVTA
jgi:2-polyprenyl-6-methoxyphenol hydroxylase-like FAD-dependent oxidoreductase